MDLHEEAGKENEQTLANLSPAEEATSKDEIEIYVLFLCFLVWPYNKHLINRARSVCVWQNLDLGRWYRPHCVRSVLATSVKILPYRPPARLIRAEFKILILNFAYVHSNSANLFIQTKLIRTISPISFIFNQTFRHKKTSRFPFGAKFILF